jgi:catechol 2,3-dioxygenase-like lactoylglutathione lyase family enzyme
MITGLAHVCFTVSDLEASIAFYEWGLGFRHAFDFTRDTGERFGAYLHVGGRSFVELFAGEVGERAEKHTYRHLCLEVDDLDATLRDLAARGIEATEKKLGTDRSWQAWITDPDGNRIELHQYTPESKQNVALD